jgi:hypothetical protein
MKLPTRNNQAFPQVSHECLPGGKKSATYDSGSYTFASENVHTLSNGLQPSILAIEGDKQVGGPGYNSSNGDANENRGKHSSPHTVTEKSFYSELVSKQSHATYNSNTNSQPFLKVDLTEGGHVFRHNAVIVRGSVHCINQRFREPYGGGDSQYPPSHNSSTAQGSSRFAYGDESYDNTFNDTITDETSGYNGNYNLTNPKRIWGLVDFEYMFVCHPLASKGSGASDYDTGYGRLSTLHSGYFHIKNRSWGGAGIQSIVDPLDFNPVDPDGSNYNGLSVYNPFLYHQQKNFVTFGLQSETGANDDDINVTSIARRQFGTDSETSTAITPYSAGVSGNSNEKWDLNHVTFRFSPPPPE